MVSPNALTAIDIDGPYRLVQARHGLMLANPNDFYIGNALLQYGEYNEIEAELLRQLLVKPGCVVEVGANIGSHTVALARLAATQRRVVHAFEPQPFVFQNLCANLALNGLQNVRAWPMACGESATTLYLSPPDYLQQGNFGSVSVRTQADAGTIAVPGVALDDFHDLGEVALIKLDVEGFELSALHGAQRLLTRHRPLLYLENDRVEQSPALIEWLWSQNYALWWHIAGLFNPRNYLNNPENIYGNVASFNMLGIPREMALPVTDLTPVTDAHAHPLDRAVAQ
jgi:FkbM family methyltransferase